MLKDTSAYNLSLAGCGFLGIYHIGVTACLRKYAPNFRARKWAGASAGAMAGVYFLCDVPIEYSVADILDICRISHSNALGLFSPTVNVTKILRDSMERHLPADAHLRCSGKIHISMTRCADLQNLIVSEFESREDLIQVVLCSGFIPVFSGWAPPLYKGVRYMDGGMSDNQPILDDNTMRVSPFSGDTVDICPRDHINLTNVFISNTSFQLSRINFSRVSQAIFPPKPEALFDTCEQGFADALRFLAANGMVRCADCLDKDAEEPESCPDCESTKKSAKSDSLPEKVKAVLHRSTTTTTTLTTSSDEGESGLFKRLLHSFPDISVTLKFL